MLFTMTKARVADPLEGKQCIREIKTVVFPDPVGKETPIRLTPSLNASKHA